MTQSFQDRARREALRARLSLDAPGVSPRVVETARALENDAAARRAFLTWRALQRSLSDPKSKRFDTPTRALAPNLDDDALLFLDQTRAAQIVQAILRRRFALTAQIADKLFDDSLFSWANAIYRNLPNDDSLDAALKLDDDVDPFPDLNALIATYYERRRLGEFYTPRPIADFLAARAERLWRQNRRDHASPTVLDPNCGAGVFLTASVRRKRDEGLAPETIASLVEGYDLAPLAIVAARANLLFALFSEPDARRPENVARLLDARESQDALASPLPARLFDALRDAPPNDESAPRDRRKFDLLLGNPPWLGWDKLSPECRETSKRYWLEYGLFNLSGKDARFGGSKKEFAGLMVYATIDRRLEQGGAFAFVLPERLMRSGKSGEGFRQFGRLAVGESPSRSRVGDAGEAKAGEAKAGEDRRRPAPFLPLELDDFTEFCLFPQVSSRTIALLGVKSDAPLEEVRVRKWRRDGTCDSADGAPELAALSSALSPKPRASRRSARRSTERSTGPAFRSAPSLPSADPRRLRVAELARELLADPARASGYRGRLGANAAGACAVFWVHAIAATPPGVRRIVNLWDAGRVKTPRVETEIEESALYPLLRWRDVDEFRASPGDAFMIIPQNPQTRRGYDPEIMRARFPLTLRYLEQFEEILRARAAYKRYQANAPYWSLYNIDESTFAPMKVVWKRMDRRLRAAAVLATSGAPGTIVPQDSLTFAPVDSEEEADYLTALLNSPTAHELATSVAAPGAKGFGSPSVLNAIKPPKFQFANPAARELAALGRECRLETRASKETDA